MEKFKSDVICKMFEEQTSKNDYELLRGLDMSLTLVPKDGRTIHGVMLDFFHNMCEALEVSHYVAVVPFHGKDTVVLEIY